MIYEKTFFEKSSRIYKSIIVSKILQQTGMKVLLTKIACKTEKKGNFRKNLNFPWVCRISWPDNQPKNRSVLGLIHFPLNG